MRSFTSARHRVVIVGAGFGGLAAARALADTPVDVLVLDARNHHTFQPLLYQVATAGLDADDVCYAVRGVFHRQRNARARLGRVTGLDRSRQRVLLSDGTEVGYDSLVLAVGAVTADFGVPGVTEHAFGLKSAADAIELRSHILRTFEAAEADAGNGSGEPTGALTMVVAGGGPTGVEMAGGLAELCDRVLRRDFPGLDIDRARVILVEATDHLLGGFSPRLSDKARRALEKLGVEVRLGTTVAEVEPDRVTLGDGTTIAARTMVWAAGVRAHPLGEALGFATERGRIVVDDRLRVPGHPEIFAIGDLAASPAPDGPLPQVAPVAVQGGRHAAAVIAAGLRGEEYGPFVYRDKGSMATVGRHAAIAQLPNGTTLSGIIGWVAWLVLHLVMLIGYRNRANVLVNWAWNYLTYDRGSRLLLDEALPNDALPKRG